MKVLLFISVLYLFFVVLVFGKKSFRKEKNQKIKSINNTSFGDNVWPKPVHLTTYETFFSVDPKNFEVIYDTEEECLDLLNKTLNRYWNLMFVEDCSLVSDNEFQTLFDRKRNLDKENNYRGILSNLTIRVNHCDTELRPGMNEKYSLNIVDNKAVMVTETIWGAIRGIDTFSQLLENIGLNQFIINTTWIEDWPRFKFRGLLLDTSRHFIPVKRLEQSLDAMAYNKLNVFHWHIVDDQSIPYVSEVLPNFSLKGAYNPKTHIYTAEDIKHIIDYAKERGIRVLVEFDTPGHTLAWGKGQLDLLTPCYSENEPNGHFGPIDPTKQSSYEFMRELLTEVVDRFPDPYLHLGGDEVDYNCWRSNPYVIAFMRNLNLITNSSQIKSNKPFTKLEEYYILKVIEISKSLNKRSVVWQEVLDNGADLDLKTLIHVWKLNNWENELYNVTKRGYQAILSSCWYINKISYGTDWHKYYNCDPHSFQGSDSQYELVIGGEATMWGEWVDASNIIGRTWPRAIAVAERLWSPKEVKNPYLANGRFNRQHCLMQKRGLRVEPSNGVGSCQCDHVL